MNTKPCIICNAEIPEHSDDICCDSCYDIVPYPLLKLAHGRAWAEFTDSYGAWRIDNWETHPVVVSQRAVASNQKLVTAAITTNPHTAQPVAQVTAAATGKCPVCGEAITTRLSYFCDWCGQNLPNELKQMASGFFAPLKDQWGYWDLTNWQNHPEVKNRRMAVTLPKLATFQSSARVKQPCVVCGEDDENLTPYFCKDCATNLAPQLQSIALGVPIVYTDPDGQWHTTNWQTHPTVKNIRNSRVANIPHQPTPLVAMKPIIFSIAPYASEEDKVRIFSQAPDTKAENTYPHTCPNCGAPAYVGLLTVDCSKHCKKD